MLQITNKGIYRQIDSIYCKRHETRIFLRDTIICRIISQGSPETRKGRKCNQKRQKMFNSCRLKMAMYCPQGSGMLRQQLLMWPKYSQNIAKMSQKCSQNVAKK